MSLSLYKYVKPNKEISSEISTNNILNYKRRSTIVSKQYYYETNKTVINTLQTLQNCYNSIYEMKNILSDYLVYLRNIKKNIISQKEVKDFKMMFSNLIEKYKIEILSAFNIIDNKHKKNNKNILQSTLENKKEVKIVKNINNIIQIIQLLYNDINDINDTCNTCII